MSSSASNLALLIDADNISHKYIDYIIAGIAIYGNISVRRIYGDWTSSSMVGWKTHLLGHSLILIQQFAYTTGKNATDGAMIIDAMALLYTGRFSSFCIASSDSDFTRLAARIREQGVLVYGYGERKTPSAFVKACNTFTYLNARNDISEDAMNVLKKATTSWHSEQKQLSAASSWFDHAADKSNNIASESTSTAADWSYPGNDWSSSGAPKRQALLPLDKRVLDGMRTAVIKARSVGDGDDWVNLALIGGLLKGLSPDFLPVNYGYSRLRDLVEASGIVDVKMKSREPAPPIALVRLKETRQSTNLPIRA